MPTSRLPVPVMIASVAADGALPVDQSAPVDQLPVPPTQVTGGAATMKPLLAISKTVPSPALPPPTVVT